MVTEDLDLVVITEAWINEKLFGDSLAEYELSGYNMFTYQRDSNIGGGILVYSKQGIRCHLAENIKRSNGVESIWLDILLLKQEKLRLGVFYRPPGLSEDKDLELQDEISRGVTDRTILLGDFNITGLVGGDEALRKSDLGLFNCFQDNFLVQLIEESTRGKEVLDLVLVNDENIVDDIQVGESLGNSDHAIIRFSIITNLVGKENDMSVPNFSQGDFVNFRNFLGQISWNNVLRGLDTDQMWQKFKNILAEGQSRFIPMTQIRKKKSKSPPWFSSSIKELIKKKKLAFRRFKEDGSEANMILYEAARDNVKKGVRRAKRLAEIELASNCSKGNAKKFFSFYKFKSSSRNVGPLEVDGEIFAEDKDIVEILSGQFSSVFTHENMSGINVTEEQFTAHKVEDLEITEDQVRFHLHEIKANKAAGPDEIYARVLKECSEQLSIPLTIIFRRSFQFAEVPDDWRNANVVPIFKKG